MKAFIDMSAQSRSAATLDGQQHVRDIDSETAYLATGLQDFPPVGVGILQAIADALSGLC